MPKKFEICETCTKKFPVDGKGIWTHDGHTYCSIGCSECENKEPIKLKQLVNKSESEVHDKIKKLSKRKYTDKIFHDSVLWKDVLEIFTKED